MRAFVLVLIGATVIGGFVGGELMESTFSITGAVIGGVGVAALLLGLGAVFHAQEERKRKESIPPEVRAVFDRMVGKGTPSRPTPRQQWKPRAFHENKSKEQVLEWFAHAEPWNRVDSRVLQALTDRLFGNPMFEVFVHSSRECDVIREYVPLGSLFDKGVGTVPVNPKVAQILNTAASKQANKFAKLLRSRKVDRSAEQSYRLALDAYESSVHVEPRFLTAYLQLAQLKQMVGKTDEAIEFCKRGLAQVAKTKAVPLPRRADMNIGGTVDEIESQLNALMRTLQQEIV